MVFIPEQLLILIDKIKIKIKINNYLKRKELNDLCIIIGENKYTFTGNNWNEKWINMEKHLLRKKTLDNNSFMSYYPTWKIVHSYSEYFNKNKNYRISFL